MCAHIAKTREEQVVIMKMIDIFCEFPSQIKDLQEELDTGAKKRKEMQSELTEMKSIVRTYSWNYML